MPLHALTAQHFVFGSQRRGFLVKQDHQRMNKKTINGHEPLKKILSLSKHLDVLPTILASIASIEFQDSVIVVSQEKTLHGADSA